jgi:hypothetical protein
MADNRMIPVCRLYENVSKTTGKRYFVGNLSSSSKILIFENTDAKEGEPGWTVFIAERESKPDAGVQPQPKTYPEAGDHGGQAGGAWPQRRTGEDKRHDR